MDEQGLIGTDEGLPWHLPEDLKRFRRLTMGKPIIMGRTTHEMIGRPLDGRPNIIMTRNPHYRSEGCHIVNSIEEALETALGFCKELEADEIFVIGGRQVYLEAIPYCQHIYNTMINDTFSGSVYFPTEALEDRDMRVISESHHSADDKNPHDHMFSQIELENPISLDFNSVGMDTFLP